MAPPPSALKSPAKPCVLCIFAKPPVAGLSKTRLAAGVGAEVAAELAGAFLQDTWSAAQRLSWARPVVASTVEDPALLGLGARSEIWMQGMGGLEQRLECILQRALREGQAAIALGADSPGLPDERLEEAWQLLAAHDAVVGPADDGGFYLLGVRRYPTGLLDGVRWSAPDTLSQTLDRLHGARMSVARLAPWFDVDVPADLERLRRLLAAGSHHAPRTWEVLQRHRVSGE